MTTVVVLADPPVEEGELPQLHEGTPLSPADSTALYRAMLTDICETIQHGAGDLLVNYRNPDQVPDGIDPEASLRELLAEEVPEPDDVRYEVQVGESYAGRVGNSLTHLLEEENEETVAVVEPTAVFLRREHVGSAAMKLRTSEAVLGPAPDGRLYFAGFSEPIDFEDSYATPAIETMTERGRDAGLAVDFMPMLPLVEESGDLATAVSLIRSRQAADRLIPKRTAALVEELGLTVTDDGSLAGGSDNS